MKALKKTVLLIAAFATVFTLGKVTANAADYDSKNGASTTIFESSSNPLGNYTVYTKFKATATGKLVIYFTDFNGYVSLCNASKKEIANENDIGNGSYVSADSPYVYQRTLTFGVKKNITYYIKSYGHGDSKFKYDSDTSTSTYTDTYSLKPVNTKISASSGSKKSKAKTIKKNKTKKGSITADSSKKDWYKFKLTKKKKITFYLNGDANNDYGFRVSVYNKKGKFIESWKKYYYIGRNNGKEKITTSFKIPKGTYYIKVERSNKASGWYTIKWK